MEFQTFTTLALCRHWHSRLKERKRLHLDKVHLDLKKRSCILSQSVTDEMGGAVQ